jgi:hypothetical protein
VKSISWRAKTTGQNNQNKTRNEATKAIKITELRFIFLQCGRRVALFKRILRPQQPFSFNTTIIQQPHPAFLQVCKMSLIYRYLLATY